VQEAENRPPLTAGLASTSHPIWPLLATILPSPLLGFCGTRHSRQAGLRAPTAARLRSALWTSPLVHWSRRFGASGGFCGRKGRKPTF
jgi:hypothetical protein